jgi:hypothetical protein
MEGYGATDEELAVIHETLSLVPRRHLVHIPRIVVGDRVGPIGTGSIEQGGNSARAGPSELHRLEITHYALANKVREVGSTRTRLCFTLLHEVGHWVHWRMTLLPPPRSRERQRIERWFRNLHYGGITRGEGERAAEAYWRYFASTLPREIRDIIERTPAFRELREE